MIEANAVACCVECRYPFHGFKPLIIPIRPQEKGEPVTQMKVYPSGCLCGDSRIEPVEKFKKRPWKT